MPQAPQSMGFYGCRSFPIVEPNRITTMPFLSLTTNLECSLESALKLQELLTDLIVDQLKKPREVIQIALADGQKMTFGGTRGPCCFVDFRGLGLTADQANSLSRTLCALLENHLKIAPNRIFINFWDVPRSHWGWNGKTFGSNPN